MFRPFAHLPTACCCVLLKVVAQNLKLVKLLSHRQSVAQQCLIRCTALPTFLGLRTCITYAHQSLMGFILHTMHCSSQQCWELLRSFARSFINTKTRNSQQLRQLRHSLNYENVCTKYPIPGSPWSNQPGKYPHSKD